MEGGAVLLPLGPPLPDDSVSAKRGVSGMLGGLTVPLSWGTAVPPDDYDHWAPPSDEVPGYEANATEPTGSDSTSSDEWDEWGEWQAESSEPRFDVPRTGGFIPRSPAAG